MKIRRVGMSHFEFPRPQTTVPTVVISVMDLVDAILIRYGSCKRAEYE